jgi:hypothetical protein
MARIIDGNCILMTVARILIAMGGWLDFVGLGFLAGECSQREEMDF